MLPRRRNDLCKFLDQAGIKPSGLELLDMALTHPTYAFEHGTADNQRLEFLGDAVLGLIVADYLYRTYPDLSEGELTRLRARIVCEDSLAAAAGRLGLGRLLLLGKGEEMSGGAERESNLADAVEAVLGALYLEGGLELARQFFRFALDPVLKEAEIIDKDYKTRLQEEVQRLSQENVSYAILEEWGPDHAKNFRAGVYFRGKLWATGTGKSKKEAEQEAARLALKDFEARKDLFSPCRNISKDISNKSRRMGTREGENGST
ncbi:MAG: ribonuclease [Clostridia bacterium]|nr:ribonuclease [Clostridia bacterium]